MYVATERMAGTIIPMRQSTCSRTASRCSRAPRRGVQKNSRAEGPARVAKKVEATWTNELRCAGGRSAGRRNDRYRLHRHSLDRLGDLGPRRGARHVPRLDDKAPFERLINALFDGKRFFANDLGNLGDDQRLGAIQHPLLAEREALRLAEECQALEHVG